MLLPNLGTLALSPGNVLVRCPECASLFQKASPTGCAECGGTRKRKKEEEEEEEKKECACDDDDVPDPNDPNTSEQWKNAFLEARGTSYGSLSLGPDEPKPWQVEAAKRKIAQLEAKALGVEPKMTHTYDDRAGRTAPAACECEEKEEEEECACDDSPKPEFRSSLGEESEDKDEAPSSSD